MSGVRVGTRLDRLYDLRRQVEDEIARERRRVELGIPYVPPPVSLGQPEEAPYTLQEIGKTAREIRRWALGRGLVDRIATGRVPQWMIDAYAAAHPDEVFR